MKQTQLVIITTVIYLVFSLVMYFLHPYLLKQKLEREQAEMKQSAALPTIPSAKPVESKTAAPAAETRTITAKPAETTTTATAELTIKPKVNESISLRRGGSTPGTTGKRPEAKKNTPSN